MKVSQAEKPEQAQHGAYLRIVSPFHLKSKRKRLFLLIGFLVLSVLFVLLLSTGYPLALLADIVVIFLLSACLEQFLCQSGKS